MKFFVGAKGVLVHKGKVLLLRQSPEYIDGVEVGKWDVPGGRINPGEEVRDGLVREVKEESGIDVVPGELLGIFDGFPVIKGEKCHVVRVYFLCELDSDVVVLSEDHDEFAWVDPKNSDGYELLDDISEIFEVVSKGVN